MIFLIISQLKINVNKTNSDLSFCCLCGDFVGIALCISQNRRGLFVMQKERLTKIFVSLLKFLKGAFRALIIIVYRLILQGIIRQPYFIYPNCLRLRSLEHPCRQLAFS